MLKYYKQLLFITLFVSAFAVSVRAQSIYNPNVHTATNKPIGLLSGPVDARSYYYDAVNYKYRPYNSTSEVLNYLPTYSRSGNFPIYIKNAGDSVDIWMFRDGTANSDLIKINQGPGSSLTLEQVSQVIHDSLSNYTPGNQIDTTSLSNRINQKLSITDTTGKWAPKSKYLFPSDTANKWAARGDYVYPSDTTGWAPKGKYLYPADTLNKWAPKGIYFPPNATITINGNTKNLKDNPTFTISGTGSSTGSVFVDYGLENKNDSTIQVDSSVIASKQWINNQGFLKTFSESDPTVPAWVKSISQGNINQWNAAEANVQSDWNETNTSSDAYIQNKPVLFSGNYNDLNNKPSIPAAQVNSDWNASSGVAQILNKPTIPTIPAKMPVAEAQAGTATTQRTIDAATLNAAIQALAPNSGGSGTDSAVVTKSPLTKNVSGTRIELGVDTAQLMTTHAFNDSVENKLLVDTTLSGVTYAVKKGYGVIVTGGDNTVLNHDVTVAADTASATGLASKEFTDNTYAKKGDVPTNNNQLINGEGYITHSDAASQIADSLANHPGGSADSITFLTHTQASDTYAPLGGFNTLTAPDGIIKISGTPKVLGTGTVYLDPAYVAVAKPDDTIPKLDTNLGADNLQNVESASRKYDINGGTLTFEDNTAPVPTRLSLNSTYNFLGTVTDDGLYGTAISQTSDVAANNAVAISASNPGGNTTLKVSRQNGFDFSGGPVSMSQYKNNATEDSVAAFTSTGAIIQKYNYNQPGTTMKFKVEGLNAAAFPYTLTADDSYLIITNVSATTEDNTIDIPVPTLDNDGRRVVIKNASDGSVTLSQTIFKYNGAPLDAIVLAPGDVLRIIAWNQTWYQL